MKTLILGAHAVSEHADGPAWVRIELTEGFLQRVEQLSALCVEHKLRSVTTSDRPAEWDLEDELRLSYDRLEVQRFIDRHGLHAYRRNPFFPVNTLKIMRGACAAQKLGCFDRYVDVVYAAMWEQERNMAEDDVILAALDEAGLDGRGLMATAQEPDVKARLLDNTQRSHARGAFGSPTFFVGEEIFFGKDRLRDVEEEILRTRG